MIRSIQILLFQKLLFLRLTHCLTPSTTTWQSTSQSSSSTYTTSYQDFPLFHWLLYRINNTPNVGHIFYSNEIQCFYSLKADIFQTMAFNLSIEINNDKISTSTKRSSLKVLQNVCRIKKKRINFEHYARLQFEGPKIAICETVPDAIFVIDTLLPQRHLFQTCVS